MGLSQSAPCPARKLHEPREASSIPSRHQVSLDPPQAHSLVIAYGGHGVLLALPTTLADARARLLALLRLAGSMVRQTVGGRRQASARTQLGKLIEELWAEVKPWTRVRVKVEPEKEGKARSTHAAGTSRNEEQQDDSYPFPEPLENDGNVRAQLTPPQTPPKPAFSAFPPTPPPSPERLRVPDEPVPSIATLVEPKTPRRTSSSTSGAPVSPAAPAASPRLPADIPLPPSPPPPPPFICEHGLPIKDCGCAEPEDYFEDGILRDIEELFFIKEHSSDVIFHFSGNLDVQMSLTLGGLESIIAQRFNAKPGEFSLICGVQTLDTEFDGWRRLNRVHGSTFSDGEIIRVLWKDQVVVSVDVEPRHVTVLLEAEESTTYAELQNSLTRVLHVPVDDISLFTSPASSGKPQPVDAAAVLGKPEEATWASPDAHFLFARIAGEKGKEKEAQAEEASSAEAGKAEWGSRTPVAAELQNSRPWCAVEAEKA
ncbi:hypothetical protein JCM10213v2_003253 [Rhodosporidiobolus nylandii]